MSQAKRLLEEQEQRGWFLAPDDAYVCADCLDDEGLIAVVESEAEQRACSYCGKTSRTPIAISVNRLFEAVASGIRYEWTDPVNELPSEDGEYVFHESIIDSDDLLSAGELVADGLKDQFLASFSHLQWVQRDFFALPYDEALMVGWNAFAEEAVRAASTPEIPPRGAHWNDIAPQDVLRHIGDAITQCEMVTVLRAGTEIYRARVHRIGTVPRGAANLGAPRPEDATLANRMSPAGQPMFYGALDEETSVVETFTPEKDKAVTIGRFTISEDIAVIDLAQIPRIPSLFDEERRYTRRPLMFLREFSEKVSEPIPRDGREDLNYRPTQLVIKYFRTTYKPLQASPVMGLMYRSLQNERPCVALFVGNGDAIDRARRSVADRHLLTLESQQTQATLT